MAGEFVLRWAGTWGTLPSRGGGGPAPPLELCSPSPGTPGSASELHQWKLTVLYYYYYIISFYDINGEHSFSNPINGEHSFSNPINGEHSIQ